ncbi:MAG TPA: DUF4350 domain-containing protein [Blastocatellia bacterium]|nr:DUF4350 domain-containing protein [Blastocatellia bacterium]
MRRYFGIIITVVIVLLVLIGLSAVSFVQLDRPPESESDPNRSSYNTGPTGTRAFYQLLEESGYQVARWRREYDELQYETSDGTLVMIGPGSWLSKDDTGALKSWVAGGGHLLIISRQPEAQFDHPSILTHVDGRAADEISANPALDNLIDKNSDVLIAQPTGLTRNVRGLAVSRLASRLEFRPTPLPSPVPSSSPGAVVLPAPAPQTPEQKSAAPDSSEQERAEAPPPPPPAATTTELESSETQSESRAGDVEPYYSTHLMNPVVHLGDSRGAVLADFDYGNGRVIILSDPFVVANNGIAQGANLTLALNLINATGGKARRILFDEAIHGYQSVSNPLFVYFRGTPVMWVFGQLVLIALLIAWSAGRRFARPLPLPVPDRHSPLEFVSSMANLQQAARARDLALENIYPRFRTSLCRRLGLSVRSKPDEIASAISRRRLKVSAIEVRRTLLESERALAGSEIDDQQLLNLVATMRRISAQLK